MIYILNSTQQQFYAGQFSNHMIERKITIYSRIKSEVLPNGLIEFQTCILIY